MMELCKNCKHWFGPGEYGICDRWYITAEGRTETVTTEGADRQLRPFAWFGCPIWEERPEPSGPFWFDNTGIHYEDGGTMCMDLPSPSVARNVVHWLNRLWSQRDEPAPKVEREAKPAPEGPFFVSRVFTGIADYINGTELRPWGVIPKGKTKAIFTYPCEGAAKDACDELNRLCVQRDEVTGQ